MERRPSDEQASTQPHVGWAGTIDGSIGAVASTVLTIGRAFDELESMTSSRVSVGEDESFSLSEASVRYEHIRLIGRGGMGQVDQVWDHDLMRKLAVKRLHPERAESPMALRQFLWEARVTAYLDHPNIVPVHDLGIDPGGDLYFTMKFVHGTSLDEVLAALARVEAAAAEGREPDVVDEVISAEHLTQLRRVRLFLDLCQAIAYAHERGVLHRDLKPANVMLGQYGEVLIMDWGLAYPLAGPAGEGLRELLPDQLQASESNEPPTGTPRYMSPEQVAGRELDARSDVYSLGVILYELLTLRSPYSATEFTRLMLQVSAGEVTPLTETGPSVPDSLVDVVNRAMALDPDDRYASVSELTDDIEAVLDGVPPAASESTILPLPPELDAPRPRASPTEAEPEGARGQAEPAARRRLSTLELAALIGSGAALALVLVNVAPALAALGPLASVGFAVVAIVLALIPARALRDRG